MCILVVSCDATQLAQHASFTTARASPHTQNTGPMESRAQYCCTRRCQSHALRSATSEASELWLTRSLCLKAGRLCGAKASGGLTPNRFITIIPSATSQLGPLHHPPPRHLRPLHLTTPSPVSVMIVSDATSTADLAFRSNTRRATSCAAGTADAPTSPRRCYQ